MKWLALISLIAANLVRLPAPVVRTTSGLVKGRVSENGKFYEYLGIPYGTVDDRNRFQAPLPPPQWEGVYEAINENSWCPQKVYGHVIFGEPNCLQLNIYKPVQANKLPVMVYIHGGCFFGGTGSPYLYGGDFFAEHGVVFVGINYRLSVEGFLCLGIKEAPGNAGLKDQIAALKWIQGNIAAFGGDPNKVTLFGESAGAVSTSFMILSPLAKGLFHKAILQSGSSLCPWALQHDPLQTASDLAKKFGHDTKDPYQIYSILSTKTAKELLGELNNEQNYCVADRNIFVPCVEKVIDGVESVITEYPSAVIQSGNYTKLPMVIGYTDNEGIYFVAADYGNSIRNNSIAIDPLTYLQRDLIFPSGFDEKCTAEKLMRHYFSSYKDEIIMDMVNYYSDVHFKVPLVLESEMYAKTNEEPIYYYVFKYSGYINMPKVISGFGLTKGAAHADELFYLFKPHAFPLPQRFLEYTTIKRMVTMWTNFAKFGDPTPKPTRLLPFKWRPSRKFNPTALVIDDKITTAPMWDINSVTLWNDTYAKYRRKDYGFKYGDIL
ncbi:hypothetical protein K1T71_010046 [Dendrolimus kikuchii]|uniref:Uncharacterized protein n=1 Tax=Dendrolimus kikuchii TaxID=765133 RepID=A0ACC1CQI8_9NEOP|nr:hypothetical protein K1T71_010046 [Dendrolimus kikuchii]